MPGLSAALPGLSVAIPGLFAAISNISATMFGLLTFISAFVFLLKLSAFILLFASTSVSILVSGLFTPVLISTLAFTSVLKVKSSTPVSLSTSTPMPKLFSLSTFLYTLVLGSSLLSFLVLSLQKTQIPNLATKRQKLDYIISR